MVGYTIECCFVFCFGVLCLLRGQSALVPTLVQGLFVWVFCIVLLNEREGSRFLMSPGVIGNSWVMDAVIVNMV